MYMSAIIHYRQQKALMLFCELPCSTHRKADSSLVGEDVDSHAYRIGMKIFLIFHLILRARRR